MELYKNVQLASEGSGAACLGSPLNALLWLAKKMVELELPLEAEELVFSGALGPFVAVESGDTIHTNISGLGSVSVHFNS